jgi:hypothetical protein
MKLELIEPQIGSFTPAHITEDLFFELGMNYSTGRAVPRDLITAHKWFNVSALRGNKQAAQFRREISEEMSKDDIALALHDAREYLASNQLH